MSNLVKEKRSLVKQESMTPEWSDEQVQLIKNSIAKGATNDEFKLFGYRCKELGLDPFKKEIYFVKYNENTPGSIIIGLDGFRKIAHRSGKLTGIERGVIRNDKGHCIGGWAKVYRSDWTKPATEEVALNEYNTGKNQWAKMPETMIKKVVECAALRMAFPNELGGVYEQSEMDQAEIEQVKPIKEEIKKRSLTPSKYITSKEAKELFLAANKKNIAIDSLKTMLLKLFNVTQTKDLKFDEFNQLMIMIESGMNAKEIINSITPPPESEDLNGSRTVHEQEEEYNPDEQDELYPF